MTSLSAIAVLSIAVVVLAALTIYRFVVPRVRTWKRRRLPAPLPISSNARTRNRAACCGDSPFYRGKNFRRTA